MADSYSGSEALDWARFIAEINESRKKGEFRDAPLTDEQRELYTWSRGRVMGLPDANTPTHHLALNGAAAAPKPIDLSASRAGRNEYRSPQRMTPDQLRSILTQNPSGTGVPNPSTPVRPSGGGGGGGLGGSSPREPGNPVERRPNVTPDFGGFVGIGRAPVDDQGKPLTFQQIQEGFAKLDSSWDAFRTAHPGLASFTQGSITALAAWIGLPLALVTRWAFNHMNAGGQGGAPNQPDPRNNYNAGQGFEGGPGGPSPRPAGNSNYSGGEDYMGAPNGWRP